MVQNYVAPYVPCELVGTPLYYGARDFKNLLFLLLQGQQPFESIPPLMLSARKLKTPVQTRFASKVVLFNVMALSHSIFFPLHFMGEF